MTGTTSEPTLSFASPSRTKIELFLISLLILFLELSCIRWFPSHVLFLTFFTNTVLLASFLGMSVGCLSARSRWNLLPATPVLLFAALFIGIGLEHLMDAGLGRFIDVGNQNDPQMVFFGTEYKTQDLAKFSIPIEYINGFFFGLIALVFIGPGQKLGQALEAIPDRVQAYTLNILGSIVGIVFFAGMSALHSGPMLWFLIVVIGLGYFTLPVAWRNGPKNLAFAGLALVVIPLCAAYPIFDPVLRDANGNVTVKMESSWSPYYRIQHAHGQGRKVIKVNLIGHQEMSGTKVTRAEALAYGLPHALHQAAGGKPINDVLIIGAGSGNDVSRALQWGAKHVDAVEIDPEIQRLGIEHHPDNPYGDPRVTMHLGDGRNFLRQTNKKYDLIIYALVDSLVLHSSYSNIRLESYLFTQQAFQDIKRNLKPNGMFVMYNYFRQGWIVARLQKGLKDVFGKEPLVLGLPYREKITTEDNMGGGFTLFFAGANDHLAKAFAKHKHYWLRRTVPDPKTVKAMNGFLVRPKKEHEKFWLRFGPAQVIAPKESLRATTDAWPFLYLRNPMIPFLTMRGMLVVGVVALALLFLFYPRGSRTTMHWPTNLAMFFLGAGFMLVETKAVVHMALLFGSTWVVNSVVFFAVLVMILAANLFVLKIRPKTLWPYYAGLIGSLLLNVVIPLDLFLGMSRIPQVLFSCVLVFTPILFAGVVFAVSFSLTRAPDRAFGFNIAGAMVGGLAENTSMLLGFQYLLLVAVAFYGLSMLGSLRRQAEAEELQETPNEAVDMVA